MVSKLREINIRAIIFYIIFFLFVLVLNSFAKTYDYDLWARLIVGKCFFQTGQVLKHDFLSYTPTHIWYDHEWGSGVIFYIVQHFLGSAGLIVLQSVLIFMIFFVITKIIALRGVKTTHPYNFLFYFFALSTINYIIRSPIRCQLFTFLFFAVFIYILELARQGKNKPLFLLPVIMLIWNNLHGGCVAGLGLIAIYFIGEFLNKQPVKKYLYALFGSIVVLPINPWGFKYLIFLLKANTMKRPDIVEWWGLFSKFNVEGYYNFKIFAGVLIVLGLAFFVKNLIAKKFDFDKTKFLVIAVTLFLAIQHVKMIPLSVITLSAFLYDDFYTAFNFLTANIFNKIAIAKDSIVYVIILIFICSNLNARAFETHLTWNNYPFSEIEFIKINKIKGNLLINFGFGSYASYKLYPNNKIFIDGRYEEVYYDFMSPLLRNFFLVDKKWDEILNRFPPDVIVVEKDYSIYQTLESGNIWQSVATGEKTTVAKDTGIAHHHRWKKVFEGPFFGVFVKPENVRKSYKNPPADIYYYEKTLFDTDIDFMLQSKHEK